MTDPFEGISSRDRRERALARAQRMSAAAVEQYRAEQRADRPPAIEQPAPASEPTITEAVATGPAIGTPEWAVAVRAQRP